MHVPMPDTIPVVSVATVVLKTVPPTSSDTTGLVLNSLAAVLRMCTAMRWLFVDD